MSGTKTNSRGKILDRKGEGTSVMWATVSPATVAVPSRLEMAGLSRQLSWSRLQPCLITNTQHSFLMASFLVAFHSLSICRRFLQISYCVTLKSVHSGCGAPQPIRSHSGPGHICFCRTLSPWLKRRLVPSCSSFTSYQSHTGPVSQAEQQSWPWDPEARGVSHSLEIMGILGRGWCRRSLPTGCTKSTHSQVGQDHKGW